MSKKHRLDKALFYFSVYMPLALSIILDYPIFHSDLTPKLFGTNTMWRAITEMGWQFSIFMSALYVGAASIYGSPLINDTNNIKELDRKGWNKRKKLIITYVSKGVNDQALHKSILVSRELLESYDVNFEIEVVTDFEIENKYGAVYEVVPKDYQTKNGSKFKAKALQYMLEKRQKRYSNLEGIWILHLDEESELTLEALAGINKFINQEGSEFWIGQGEIKYNSRNYSQNLWVTAADARRTGDDLTRFRIQYQMFKRPLFGMHGSYILVPAEIENKVTFDQSSKGSITEDAYFAMKAWEMKIPCRWIDGFIREQSPQTMKELLKQRRRWFSGLSVLSLDKDIKFRHRIFIGYMIFWWLISIPLMLLFGLRLVLIQVTMAQFIIAMIGYFSFRSFGPVYMLGAYRNLLDAKMPITKKIIIYFLTLIMAVPSILFEGLASMYAIFKPIRIFEVVKKV